MDFTPPSHSTSEGSPSPPAYPPSSRPSLGFPAYLYPTGTHSLSGIAARAAVLGFVVGGSLVTSILLSTSLVPERIRFPQLPFFLTLLSLFHILEYWVTARYNTSHAKTDAFLLTTNGAAYNIAHTAATAEALIELYFFPTLKTSFRKLSLIGFLFIILGQVTRTLAMAHAGTNFNHNIQRQRQHGHRLVTTGMYAWLRHPSYFGFFWWGVGTQIMLCNPVCTLGYAVVLWKFFRDRIDVEEKLLVVFFGDEYRKYRSRTPVGIPFIH